MFSLAADQLFTDPPGGELGSFGSRWRALSVKTGLRSSRGGSGRLFWKVILEVGLGRLEDQQIVLSFLFVGAGFRIDVWFVFPSLRRARRRSKL